MKDAAKSVKWFRLAAEQGNANGQTYLGLMYEDGTGVLKDLVAAHMWFNIGSANGNKDGRDYAVLSSRA